MNPDPLSFTDAGAISEDDRTVPQHSGSGPQHSGSGSHKPSLSISDLSETLYRQYSVQALMMLAQLVAPLLDVVYSSDEKDKVLPLLTTIMHHVFPYLRNHRYVHKMLRVPCTLFITSIG